MCVRGFISALILLKLHLCITECLLTDRECERYDSMENYSTRAYFTCIRDSEMVTMSARENCPEIGTDWAVTGNRKVYVCADNKYKIKKGPITWTSGDLLTHGKCKDPGDPELIVAYKSECVLLTNQSQSWEDAVHACINISRSQQWGIIAKINGDKQDFLEQFLLDESPSVEVWIGLQRRLDGFGGRFRWHPAGVVKHFIDYVDDKGEEFLAPGQAGPCYATAGAGSDRVGGGWRGRPCNTTLPVLCQASTDPKYITQIDKTTSTSTKKARTTTPKPPSSPLAEENSTEQTPASISTTTPASTTSVTTSTSTTKPATTPTSTPSESIDLKTVVELTTIVDNSTLETTSSDSSNPIWIYILVAVGVIVLIVCVILVYIKRRKRHHRIVRINQEAEYSSPSTIQPSTPFLNSNNTYAEADQVLPKEKTTLYNHINITEGAQELTYDTANHKGTQPSVTLDATYDRANFIQPGSTDVDVYDVARIQPINTQLTEEDPSSTYDHAFVTR